MSTIARFLIRLTPAPAGYTATFSTPDDAAWQHTRTLLMVEAGAFRFPRPDPDERDDLPEAGALHHPLCLGDDTQPLLRMYRSIIDRQPRKDDVEAFGRYLFDTLIGPTLWGEMRAKAVDAGLLELALAWDATETNLHRLNWEMMHGPEAFLAAMQPMPPYEVAVTRIVAGAAAKPGIFHATPRKLFLVGTHLNDEEIRAGAEYLGLLRRLRKAGRTVHSRVLLNSSPEKLEDTVRSFQPDVVHFICHGNIDDDGNGYLELALDATERDASVRRRTVEQLHSFLGAGARRPDIVVLSACYSGVMLGAHKTAPLAAQLVARGIPVVVGMAGRVSDSACRHFTRRFGEALVQDLPLVKATTDGRRAAFAHGADPYASVDWAFPAVFLSEAVPADYTPAREATDAAPVESWVRAYDVDREPVFCGRYEFFDDFYALFEATGPSVLAAYSDPHYGDLKLGKTRLLQELTIQAIREAHLPIAVIVEKNQQKAGGSENEPPRTLDDLRKALFRALENACRAYFLGSLPWRVLKLSDAGSLGPEDADIKNELLLEGKITARALQLALSKDLEDLLRTAVEKYPAFFHPDRSRPVLLLDDIDQYHLEVLESWYEGGVLGSDGLGRAGNRIPVIVTFSVHGPARAFLQPLTERGGWLQARRLELFSPQLDEDLLAYERVWLHPFDEKLLPGWSGRAFAVDMERRSDVPQAWQDWLGQLRGLIKGYPPLLKSSNFYLLAQIGHLQAILQAADDERLLEEYARKHAGDH